MKYICSGNIMSDSIWQPDGTTVGPNLGGPALFAFAGVRLYSDDCQILAGVGADFDEVYGKWCKDNDVDQSQIWRMVEKTKHNILVYNEEDGTYGGKEHGDQLRYYQDFGYTEATPDRFALVCDENSCLYYPHDTFNMVSWENFFKVKADKKFKYMWEIHANSAIPQQLENIKWVISQVEMFSVNYPEMKNLMGAKSELEAIDFIKSIFSGFSIMRVGKKGMYTIFGDKHYFIPSINSEHAVDPTGCGNCSTGAAMYAFCETKDPIMAGIMANISAGYNVLQYGPYPHFTQKERTEALALAKKLRAEYKEQ